jgi:hypothetical protein
VIADSNAGNASANFNHDACTFVAEYARKHTFGIFSA